MNTLPVKLMKLDHTKIAKNKLTPSPLIYTYLVTWLGEIKNHIEKCVKKRIQAIFLAHFLTLPVYIFFGVKKIWIVAKFPKVKLSIYHFVF